MFFGILGLNGRLDYINAGHPSPIVLRRGDVTEPFIEGSFPVGLLPETGYVTSRAELQPDDTLSSPPFWSSLRPAGCSTGSSPEGYS